MMKISYLFLLGVVGLFPVVGMAQANRIKGFTEPYRSIEVAAPEMGTLATISVAEGDTIRAGDILANLNEDVLTASLAMANESRAAKGKLNSALADLKLQTARYEKLKGLFERRHASQTELDRSQSQLDIATAQVESVRDDLRIRTFEVKRIQAQLEQRRLRSPIDGTVTQVFKQEGEFVSANDPVVVTVVQLDPLLVVFSVPQEASRQLRSGQMVNLVVEDDSRKVEGLVEFVSPTADAQSGTCRVKIKIANANLELASGRACYLSDAFAKTAKADSSKAKMQPVSYGRKLKN